MAYYARQVATVVKNSTAKSADLNDELNAIVTAFNSVEADVFVAVESDAATSRTLTATDNGKLIAFTAGTTITLTLPDDGTEDLVNGFRVTVIQGGAGEIDFDDDSGGSTIYSPGVVGPESSGQGAKVDVIKWADNTWTVSGDITAG